MPICGNIYVEVLQAQAAADPAAAGEAAGPADGAASASEPFEVLSAQQGDGNQPSQPLPLPYQLDADGKKQPLPGSKSIFVRGMYGLKPKNLG